MPDDSTKKSVEKAHAFKVRAAINMADYRLLKSAQAVLQSAQPVGEPPKDTDEPIAQK